MDKAEFDKFADEYRAMHKSSVKLSGEEPEYFAEYKIADIAKEYAGQRGDITGDLKILDFGAGVGGSVPYVAKYFPNCRLQCIDPSERSLEIAKTRFPDAATYLRFDGTTIPFPDDSFDIAYAMCVFHHIEAQQHVKLMSELRRVLKPSGLLFIFEHNPYNPLTVRIVRDCPFDENAVLIPGNQLALRLSQAGFRRPSIRYRVFFPHFLALLRPLETVLRSLPLGGQYYSMSGK